MHMNISFGPVDQLNPRAGYSVEIRSTTGRVIYSGAIDPASGKPLRSVGDCLQVVGYYSDHMVNPLKNIA